MQAQRMNHRGIYRSIFSIFEGKAFFWIVWIKIFGSFQILRSDDISIANKLPICPPALLHSIDLPRESPYRQGLRQGAIEIQVCSRLFTLDFRAGNSRA
jgi:hypothetical protein